ncbi:uncharacterized protein LOC117586354 [Drosophila guanche]|uniref:Uncharacterized protein n=1 Tax=Drosophila guanche TaxID=7266 RepID=A0A3B0KFT9_DROGU|nr:uncharacterized protein LOC117586354 [Drosophila guanche]SPP84606.1 Hypothetical predicted protein [Drosophila guanche]
MWFFFCCFGSLAILVPISFVTTFWNSLKCAGKYLNKMKTRSQVVHKKLQAPENFNERVRNYLINGPNRSDICDKVVVAMGQVNIAALLIESGIEDDKLRNIFHVLAQRLKCMRLQLADIPRLLDLCRRIGAPELTAVRALMVLAGENGSQLELLGSLTPAIEVLKVCCSIDGPFPKLKKVCLVHLIGPVAQKTLEELFRNCPSLRNFELKDDSSPPNNLDIQSIMQCSHLQVARLPLLLKNPIALCKLSSLKYLSLHSEVHWQRNDWLVTVQQIINAKQLELGGICFDGTYLRFPLNLSSLLLARCTALTEVHVSHCKLVEDSNQPLPLPFSCQRLRLRHCTLGTFNLFLESCPVLQQIDVFNCKFFQKSKVLSQALAKRKTQPIMRPVYIKVSESQKLELEYKKWSPEEQLAAKHWLDIEVLKKGHVPFLEDMPLGTIVFRFVQAKNRLPAFMFDPSYPGSADLKKELEALELAADLPSAKPAESSN